MQLATVKAASSDILVASYNILLGNTGHPLELKTVLPQYACAIS